MSLRIDDSMRYIRQLAEKLKVYDFIRYSRPYEWLLNYRNPGYLANLRNDLAFYRRVLAGRACRLIFDVGANFGDKAWVFNQIAGRVVCFEPDPRCAAALRVRFRRSPHVIIENVAIGAEEQTAPLFVESNGSAYNTLSDKHRTIHHGPECRKTVLVTVVQLDRMINKHGLPDFLKVDVEGFEAAVFSGLTRIVPVISFEANIPAFLEETLIIIDRLRLLNPQAQFNALPAGGHDLAFPAAVSPLVIQEFLAGTETRTFDVFVFNDSPFSETV